MESNTFGPNAIFEQELVDNIVEQAGHCTLNPYFTFNANLTIYVDLDGRQALLNLLDTAPNITPKKIADCLQLKSYYMVIQN